MDTPWSTKCSCEQSERNIILACPFHDIGKCGDLVFSFNEKKEHPDVEFDYLTGIKQYHINENTPCHLNAMLHSFGLEKDDIAFMAIVAGMHHDLGALMRGLKTRDTNCFNMTLNKLDSFIAKSSFKGGFLDRNSKEYKKLIKCICLISTADVISSQVVPFTKKHDIISTVAGTDLSSIANCHCETLSDGLNGYQFFDYDTFRLQARRDLLAKCV